MTITKPDYQWQCIYVSSTSKQIPEKEVHMTSFEAQWGGCNPQTLPVATPLVFTTNTVLLFARYFTNVN